MTVIMPRPQHPDIQIRGRGAGSVAFSAWRSRIRILLRLRRMKLCFPRFQCSDQDVQALDALLIGDPCGEAAVTMDVLVDLIAVPAQRNQPAKVGLVPQNFDSIRFRESELTAMP